MKTYKDFKEVKKYYLRESKKQTQKNIEGMLCNWENVRDRYINEYLTKREQNKITTESETKKAIIQKMKENTKKDIETFNAKADAIAQAERPTMIFINITWNKSQVWGYNPSVNVTTYGKNANYFLSRTQGRASGCGYDKRSSAVAEAFNDSENILKIIYSLWEEALRKGENVRDFVGYGSGYFKPYFEGGVGYSCFKNIFDNAGAKVNVWNEYDTSDNMYISF